MNLTPSIKQQHAVKITSVIARYLLGLTFLVFGLNGFFHFIPVPPPTGVARQFLGSLFVSHFMTVVFLIELISAVLLLMNRFVPLALALLAPLVVNILLFHILMEPSSLVLALVVAIPWTVVFFSVRTAFAGLWLSSAPVEGLK